MSLTLERFLMGEFDLYPEQRSSGQMRRVGPMRRVSKKPVRFSDMRFVKGSGAVHRKGYDETDMKS